MKLLQNNRGLTRLVWALSIAIPVVVALLFTVPPMADLDPELAAKMYRLPMLNAMLNGTAFLCLIGSFLAIRNQKVALHRNLNLGALTLSLLFLVSYVIFHATTESTPFGGEGSIRTLYFFILLSHILLSIVIIPLALWTTVRGLQGDVVRHKKIARYTWPLWLYVTATGVVVYLMISPYYPY
jgi:putative membrane protein|tara:strand:+ start:99 stop:647 length:549 start_codon:yes stop_codon:yes gene_type:complete